MLKWTWPVTLFLLGGCHALADDSPPAAVAPHFSGRALVVASDGDMVGTAYADGNLGRIAGIRDALTVVALPLDKARPVMTSVPVSSSVIPWPADLAISSDGRFAYVAEGREPGSPTEQHYDDVYTGFPSGHLVNVVRIANPAAPALVKTVPVGRNPVAVAASPDGSWLAVATEEPGAELVLAPLGSDGAPGTPSRFPIPSVEREAGKGVGSVAWHPSGRYLALTIANRRVAFFSVSRQADGRPALAPLGGALEVGTCLSIGSFTPDGRFYVVSDVNWGEKPLGFLFNGPGQLTAIRFEPAGGHEVSSQAQVGISPEGFAMSPDGTLLAAVNMRRTYLPGGFPTGLWPARNRSSLSLVALDPATGILKSLSEQEFDGLMPEHATFDASGRGLAVTLFHERADAPRDGWVAFWNVEQAPVPRLVQTDFRLKLPRGAHTIALVP